MAAEVVQKEAEIISRLNDSASVRDAEMTAIRLALEDASETRDKIAIHTYSMTAVNILNNKKQDLNIITRAIRYVASRLTQMPSINWIPAHTGIPGNEKVGLQLDIIDTIVNVNTFRVQTRMKEQMTRYYNEQAYHDASQQTKDHRRLHLTAQGGS